LAKISCDPEYTKMIRNSHVDSMDINTLEITWKESVNEYIIILIKTTELQNKYKYCYLEKNMH